MIISNIKITTNAIGFEEGDDVVILPKKTLNEWYQQNRTPSEMMAFIKDHAKDAFAVIEDVNKISHIKR